MICLLRKFLSCSKWNIQIWSAAKIQKFSLPLIRSLWLLNLALSKCLLTLCHPKEKMSRPHLSLSYFYQHSPHSADHTPPWVTQECKCVCVGNLFCVCVFREWNILQELQWGWHHGHRYWVMAFTYIHSRALETHILPASSQILKLCTTKRQLFFSLLILDSILYRQLCFVGFCLRSTVLLQSHLQHKYKSSGCQEYQGLSLLTAQIWAKRRFKVDFIHPQNRGDYRHSHSNQPTLIAEHREDGAWFLTFNTCQDWKTA